jgi:hypothetical protein
LCQVSCHPIYEYFVARVSRPRTPRTREPRGEVRSLVGSGVYLFPCTHFNMSLPNVLETRTARVVEVHTEIREPAVPMGTGRRRDEMTESAATFFSMSGSSPPVETATPRTARYEPCDPTARPAPEARRRRQHATRERPRERTPRDPGASVTPPAAAPADHSGPHADCPAAPRSHHEDAESGPSRENALPEHLVEELASILADALVADVGEFPNLAELQASREDTIQSRRGLDRPEAPVPEPAHVSVRPREPRGRGNVRRPRAARHAHGPRARAGTSVRPTAVPDYVARGPPRPESATPGYPPEKARVPSARCKRLSHCTDFSKVPGGMS